MPARPTASTNGDRAHCLMLVPRGYDAPLDLLDGLRQRRVPVRELHDAPAVMAELALCAGGGRLVVIIEPDALRHADALARAIMAYHPRVPVWSYRHRQRPALQAWPQIESTVTAAGPTPQASVVDESPAPEAAAPAQAKFPEAESIVEPSAEPATEPVPEPAPEPAPDTEAHTDASAEPPEDDDGPLLTDEELSMLLGEQPDASEGERR